MFGLNMALIRCKLLPRMGQQLGVEIIFSHCAEVGTSARSCTCTAARVALGSVETAAPSARVRRHGSDLQRVSPRLREDDDVVVGFGALAVDARAEAGRVVHGAPGHLVLVVGAGHSLRPQSLRGDEADGRGHARHVVARVAGDLDQQVHVGIGHGRLLPRTDHRLGWHGS
ncbi:hypothetical protein ON010_g12967 [Phytophthora cinnamomi]|nr:hypothetical protein ON010_g12967 [Phytophthora cinnamomi]